MSSGISGSDDRKLVDEQFFQHIDGPFGDVRALTYDSARWLKFYHRVENWEGLLVWKSAAEMALIKDAFYGVDAKGNAVPRNYLWIEQLDHHLKLAGVPGAIPPDAAEGVHKDVVEHFKKCADKIEATLIGTNIREAFRAIYVAIIFGRHIYIEGSSGIGKTAVVRKLCKYLGVPYKQFDAYADATDLALLGGEIPQSDSQNALKFTFERGPLLSPGLTSLVIDELPRLPASTSNVLLQAMAERKVSVSLVASGRGTSTILLSPMFTVVGTGNPIGYGGQGERSLALFDRFDIGIEMGHPNALSRLSIIRNASAAIEDNSSEVLECGFTLYQARALVERIVFPSVLMPILIMASYALGPDDFLSRTATQSPFDSNLSKSSAVGQDEKAPWQVCEIFLKTNKRAYDQLRDLVNNNLIEGSNPRGEISVVRNSQASALLSWEIGKRDAATRKLVPPFVDFAALREGFVWANMARLKTYPGAERHRADILKRAADLFFDFDKWESAFRKAALDLDKIPLWKDISAAQSES